MVIPMKHKTLIYAIIIAIGVIGVTTLVILGSRGGGNVTPADPTGTTGTEVNVQNPPVTGEPTVPPVTDVPTDPTTLPDTEPFDPNDPVGNGDVAPDEIPDDGNKVHAVDGTVEDGQKQTPETSPEVTDAKVTTGQKDKTEDKPAEVENEIINDSELEKKEEAEKKKTEEAEKDDKPVSVIGETEEKSEDANNNGNAPVFVDPAQGGPNPFEGGGESEIDDHGSDEFIGDGDDRPGEGIHF